MTPVVPLHCTRAGSMARRPTRTASPSSIPILLILLLGVVGCSVNPVTGQRQFVLFTERQEISMGREADRDIVESLGEYDAPELREFVEELGARMAAESERPDLPWTFRVLDDPTINAFALPGGYIYLTRGILAHFNSEAELAGVVGHEIGHVTARHGVTRVSRAQLAQVGLGAAMILSPELQPFGEAVGAGVQLLFLANSRSDERQVDELGFRYMREVGYDPRELASVFEMLGRASGAADGDRIPGFLSTHPDPLERRDEVIRMVEQEGVDLSEARVGRESYLRMLDGMVYGTDPREGYFVQETFYHPEMAFRLAFPDGWATVNARTRVQGVSPERDAVVLVELAERADPSEARTAFLAQGGVEPLRRWDEEVEGLRFWWADFRAQADGSALQGRVLFVRHGDHTFRILGYAPRSVWDRREDALVRSLASFREVTDPDVLGVEPRRIRLVEIARDMTLEEFMEAHPSNASQRVVGEINHLDAGQVVPAGTLLKRIVGGPVQ